MTALFLVVILGVSALAVDLGMQRVVRRDMQALSDVVALDMVRGIKGRTKAAIEADPQWSTDLDASIGRNTTTLGDPPTVVAVLGVVDPATGVFTPAVNGADIPTAVKVTSNSAIPFSFTSGRGGAVRSAIASVLQNQACWKVGSWAARLAQSGNLNLAGGLIDKTYGVNLSVLDYQGIAGANLTLGELATQLHVGTVEQLLDAKFKVGEYLQAAATALTLHGDAASVASAQKVQALIVAMQGSSNTVMSGTFVMAAASETDSLSGAKQALFSFDTTGKDAAAATQFNALDLVAGAAFIANGTNSIAVPNISLDLPGVAVSNTSLRVTQGPIAGCGTIGDQLRSSQATLHIDATIQNGLPAAYNGAAIPLSIDVNLGNALTTLTAITCGTKPTPDPASPEGISVKVDTSVGTLTVGVPANTSVNLSSVTNLSVSGLVDALGGVVTGSVSGNGQVSVAKTQTVNAATSTVTFTIPTDSYGDMKSTGSPLALTPPAATVTAWNQTNVGILTWLTSATNQATIKNKLAADVVQTVTDKVVTRVNTQLLAPLSDLLGLRVAGADIWVLPRPVCGVPALVG